MTGPPLQAKIRLALAGPLPVMSVSDDIEKLLGFSGADFLASRVLLKDRIHPEDGDISAALFSPEIENPSGTFNIRLRHADGRIRCIKGKYKKELDPANGYVILDLALRDARNIAEAADASLKAGFTTLIEHTSDYIYLKNRNHVFLAANQPLATLTESACCAAGLLGKTDYDIYPEPVADTSYRLEKQLFAQRRCVNQIQQLPAQDGTRHWIDDRKYPINNQKGEITGLFGLAPDITEHIDAELKMRESEESLREAQEIACLCSFVLDIGTGVWKGSGNLEAILGIDASHPRTVDGWISLIHPDDRATMADRVADLFARKMPSFSTEYRIIRPSDGAVRWMNGMGRLEFDALGNPGKICGTIQDITERKQAEEALRESKELLQLFIGHAPAAMAMLDREMRYLAVSRCWVDVHKLGGRDLIGRSHYEIFPALPENWKDEHRRALAGEAINADECILQRDDGSVQWLQRELRPWFTGSGDIGGIIIFTVDITQKKETEDRLRLAASVFTNAREGILITDPSGAILEVNDTFTRLTGYTRDEVLGRNPRILKSGLQSQEFYENMWRSLVERGHWSGEIWIRAKNGDVFAEILTIGAVRGANGNLQQYVALFSDVTELKEQQRRLEKVAHYDVLTGLPNRALFADRLSQAMAQAHRSKRLLAVAYFDLDGFKAINDRYGHLTGDALLTAVAYRMKRVLRKGDTLARLGGDEFAAVMLDLPDTGACETMLKRLLAAASKEAQIGDFVLRVSATAGVTFYPQTEQVDAEVLLRQADQAMYQAKLAGRNRYHRFDPRHDLTVRERHENLDQVRQALAARQFTLYYQPIVNMRTGKVVGAEALVRWQHPRRGLLLPAMFLPVIEDHPLAVELGEWTIASALAQIESWDSEGLDIRVNVNLLAMQLQQPDFVDRLRALLAAHPRVKPSSLQLEVLETSALEDIAQTSEVLHACHELGVSIALDDFGTGYSSLTYLKRLPAGVLKIDRSFVSDMLDDPESLTILEGVLGLANAFHRQVIAEGVETVEHGAMLLQMGCELAQGYGIARPMPAGDLPGWAAAWRPDPRWVAAQPVSNDIRPLLYAGVEHRAWMAALEAYLQGARPAPPILDARQCRFGMWLEAEKLAGRATLPAFKTVDDAHRQIHELAAEIVASRARLQLKNLRAPAKSPQLQ